MVVIHEDEREVALENLHACCNLLTNSAQVHTPVHLVLNAVGQLIQSAVRRSQAAQDGSQTAKRPRLEHDQLPEPSTSRYMIAQSPLTARKSALASTPEHCISYAHCCLHRTLLKGVFAAWLRLAGK